MRGSTLDVRRQILTTKIDPCAARVKSLYIGNEMCVYRSIFANIYTPISFPITVIWSGLKTTLFVLGAWTVNSSDEEGWLSMGNSDAADFLILDFCTAMLCGGPIVVVSTAAFHARVWGSVPGGLKLPHPRVKVSILGSLCDREVACSASDRQGSNFESCVWRTVSSQSSHHPQEVLLAQLGLYVHKGGIKPDSFHLLPCFHAFFKQV